MFHRVPCIPTLGISWIVFALCGRGRCRGPFANFAHLIATARTHVIFIQKSNRMWLACSEMGKRSEMLRLFIISAARQCILYIGLCFYMVIFAGCGITLEHMWGCDLTRVVFRVSGYCVRM